MPVCDCGAELTPHCRKNHLCWRGTARRRMAWSSSDRRSRLPKDWAKRREATKRRAKGKCEGISLHGEPRWHVADCNGVGTDCDHDQRGDDHSLSNLRWLSSECHKRKTQLERPSRKRPTEAHPNRRSVAG